MNPGIVCIDRPISAITVSLSIAAIFAFLLCATTAGAATFSGKAPGISAVIHTNGVKINKVDVHYRVHCSNGDTTTERMLNKKFNVPINQKTHRFALTISGRADDQKQTRVFKGTVHNRSITGFLSFYLYSNTVDEDSYTCRTGTKAKQNKLRFFAVGGPIQPRALHR